MKKIIINENQKGFLFQNGKYVKLLAPGKYYEYGGREIEVCSADHQPVACEKCSLETLLADETTKDAMTVFSVGDEEIGLHYIDGNFSGILRRGKRAFWKTPYRHECRIVDISSPIVSEDFPTYIFASLPTTMYVKAEVADYQKALVYFDKRLEKVLDAGTYYFWKNAVNVEIQYVDTRFQPMTIVGQEVLTADKVTLRINFICNYRVTDYLKARRELYSQENAIRTAAQMALREYVGKYKLDEILENKNEISDFVSEKLKAREAEFFAEISDASVKDIILPGEIREIMNTVLVAEKAAQANVITRREEVASTRSLLNTAKLMEENPTLYKLKEMEYIQRICENVGNITLNAGGDILAQLVGVLRSEKQA